jgi:hypothetical protein
MSSPRFPASAVVDARRAVPFSPRAVLFIGCVSVALLLTTPAAAAPVMPSIDGCVSELPDNRATWTSTRHFQFVAFWDPIAGCDPTIYQPILLHQWFENFDGTGGLKVETLWELFPKCGRIQFDAHAYISATSAVLDDMGLVSLVFNTGVDCGPTMLSPDFAPPTLSPPPPVAPIPEAGSLVLLGTGLAFLKRRYGGKQRGRV